MSCCKSHTHSVHMLLSHSCLCAMISFLPPLTNPQSDSTRESSCSPFGLETKYPSCTPATERFASLHYLCKCGLSFSPVSFLPCSSYNAQSCSQMPLLIVACTGPSLLGRDWLATIQLDWKGIHQVYNASLLSVLDQYPDVFGDGLGIYTKRVSSQDLC